MKKVILLLAVAISSVLMMAQTNQVTWVNGRAVLGQSISSIDSIKYGIMEGVDTIFMLLPKTIIVHDTVEVPCVIHDTVIVHDTIIINKCDSSYAPEGVEMVDLGLPSGLKWANMNVGATTITEYGDYFAWGETEPKKNYSTSTYKYYKDSSYTTVDKDGFEITEHYSGYTKYVRSEHASSYGFNGFYDDKITLDPEDDAAHVNWGGNWRMPTFAEIQELKANCTWKWVTLQGVNGYKVTGSNGNWIFLPASGYRYDSSLSSVGSIFNYWSSSLDEDYSDYAYYLNFKLDYVHDNRYFGQSVRPVCQ